MTVKSEVTALSWLDVVDAEVDVGQLDEEDEQTEAE